MAALGPSIAVGVAAPAFTAQNPSGTGARGPNRYRLPSESAGPSSYGSRRSSRLPAAALPQPTLATPEWLDWNSRWSKGLAEVTRPNRFRIVAAVAPSTVPAGMVSVVPLKVAEPDVSVRLMAQWLGGTPQKLWLYSGLSWHPGSLPRPGRRRGHVVIAGTPGLDVLLLAG